MLKIKDNVDLKELEKFGIKPIYSCNNLTGETYIMCLVSERYVGKFGVLKLYPKKKGLQILGKTISNNNRDLYLFRFEYDTYVDIDLLYDLIKADLVEKVKD